MKKAHLAFAAAAILFVFLLMAGCSKGNEQDSTPTPTPPPIPTPTPAGDAVVMKGVQFKPAALTVEIGTTVTWTNRDPIEHTVTPVDKIQWGSEGSGDGYSDWIKQGDSWSFTFTKPGVYKYYCVPHTYKDGSGEYKGMVGEVVVDASAVGQNELKVDVVNLVGKENSFTTGIYYSYDFPQGYEDFSKPFDPAQILRQLEANGVPVKEGWYKGYASACCPPGADFCMQVIVSPGFVVRLEADDPRMRQFGFSRSDLPTLGMCTYSVVHYTFS